MGSPTSFNPGGFGGGPDGVYGRRDYELGVVGSQSDKGKGPAPAGAPYAERAGSNAEINIAYMNEHNTTPNGVPGDPHSY